MSRRRRLPRLFLFATFTLVVAGALVELAATGFGAWRRTYAAYHPKAPLYIQRDAELGWRAMPERQIALGEDRSFTTDGNGWRRDDRLGTRPLLVVLGDSFTHAVGVADGSVYYDRIAATLGVGIAALAVNGYGTVQALALSRRERPLLPPPVGVLLQLTDNDVINNSLALERRSWRNNNLLPRPYLSARDSIVLRDPRRLHERSTLGRQLTRRLLAPHLRSVEDRIEAHDPGIEALYGEELRHTGRALRLLRRAWAPAPVWAFDVSGSHSRMGRDLARLSAAAGIVYLDLGMPFADPASRAPLLQADGAHWTERGHALAGRRLAVLLRQRGFSPQAPGLPARSEATDASAAKLSASRRVVP